MDNPKAIVKETEKYGLTVFARQDIYQGEIIAIFDGLIYEAEKSSDLPNDLPLEIRDHVIQFEDHKWRDANGIARCLSHSCDPNCGIQDLFKIVAMRDIKKGEELCWDYEMSENSDWQMECLCGSQNCRKLIGAYRYMPQKVRKKYGNYISEWLTEECMLLAMR